MIIDKKLEFADELDKKDEMEIIVTFWNSEECFWINKDDAVAIINHLKNKFKIDI